MNRTVVFAVAFAALIGLTLGARGFAVEAQGEGASGDLVISELMYHPPAEGDLAGNLFEFVELYNRGDQPIALSGFYFSAGITYAFGQDAQLAAGDFLILSSSPQHFEMRYAQAADAQFTGQLNNGGERITLADGADQEIYSVRYDNEPPWPVAADGAGFSLIMRDVSDRTADPNLGENWLSGDLLGSPRALDPAQSSAVPPIVINEILAHTDPPLTDAIELYNPLDSAVDAGGWFLSDNRAEPRRFRIADGTVIPAQGYLVLRDFGFALSALGEEIYLFAADTNGNFSGYNHGFQFGATANSVSLGRYITSTGAEHFPAQTALTLGEHNAGPLIGPVVINAIMYHPLLDGIEYVELKNISTVSIPLYDPQFPANTWHLEGVGGYVFAEGITLPADATLLIAGSDPALFRERYQIPPAIQIVGPFAGSLSNNGESLRLMYPDRQNADGSVPYIEMDVVEYDDAAPWPDGAAGQGMALHRIDPSAYGNDPINWRAGNDLENSHRVFIPLFP